MAKADGSLSEDGMEVEGRKSADDSDSDVDPDDDDAIEKLRQSYHCSLNDLQMAFYSALIFFTDVSMFLACFF